MKVKMDYFRPNGKYQSEGEFETSPKPIHQIWEEVRALRDIRNLPGLIEGHGLYLVAIDVPEHEHNHPHLITIERQA